MKNIHNQTYYELLEIDPSASQEEILKAYNRARATYGHNSPALYTLFNKEEAQELLKLIDEAYAVLSNQYKRHQYDIKTTGTSASPYVPPPEPKPNAQPSTPVAAPVTRVTPKTLIPGPGITPFGEYSPDSSFEEEIKNAKEFSGPYLQKIRLYKKISLDQISEAIKVSRPYLMAIESDTFTSLPAPVFVRGFLVQIAKVLNLNANIVANSYLARMKETQKK